MSLRAELVRIGVRWFIKRRRRPTVAAARRSIRAAARWIPRPPAGTEVRAVDAGGVPGELVATAASRLDRHVLFLHGGGYVTGSPALYRHFTWRIATAARARVLAIDYRLAPEHPFPAALDDALAAYRWLVAGRADPRRTAVAGDSAGGLAPCVGATGNSASRSAWRRHIFAQRARTWGSSSGQEAHASSGVACESCSSSSS